MNNRALLPLMPEVYRYALVSQAPRDQTFFKVLVGPRTAFEHDGLKMPDDFPDGLNDTILVIEAANAVPWTQPADVAYTQTIVHFPSSGRTYLGVFTAPEKRAISWYYSQMVRFALSTPVSLRSIFALSLRGTATTR